MLIRIMQRSQEVAVFHLTVFRQNTKADNLEHTLYLGDYDIISDNAAQTDWESLGTDMHRNLVESMTPLLDSLSRRVGNKYHRAQLVYALHRIQAAHCLATYALTKFPLSVRRVIIDQAGTLARFEAKAYAHMCGLKG